MLLEILVALTDLVSFMVVQAPRAFVVSFAFALVYVTIATRVFGVTTLYGGK